MGKSSFSRRVSLTIWNLRKISICLRISSTRTGVEVVLSVEACRRSWLIAAGYQEEIVKIKNHRAKV